MLLHAAENIRSLFLPVMVGIKKGMQCNYAPNTIVLCTLTTVYTTHVLYKTINATTVDPWLSNNLCIFHFQKHLDD